MCVRGRGQTDTETETKRQKDEGGKLIINILILEVYECPLVNPDPKYISFIRLPVLTFQELLLLEGPETQEHFDLM